MAVYRRAPRVQREQPKLIPVAIPSTDKYSAGHSSNGAHQTARGAFDATSKGYSGNHATARSSAAIDVASKGTSQNANKNTAKGFVEVGGKGISQNKNKNTAKGFVEFSGKGYSSNHASAFAQPFSLAPILLSRAYKALLRVSTYNYGTLEAYRAAVWHEPLIVDVPEPTEGLRDQFGIQSGDSLSVDIADTALRAVLEAGTLDGAQVLIEWITTSYFSDATSSDNVFARMYTVTGYAYKSGLVTLKLVDLEDARLTALYPAMLFNATDWPQIFADHVGRAVPVAVGTAVKIPCSLISTGAGAGPWKYAVCIASATVLTVYRSGQIVPSGQYTVSTQTSGGYTVVTLSFALEQVDFSGTQYTIEADVTGMSNNAVTELQRLLTSAGVTIDATTFALAVSYATTNKMFVDFAHTTQRFYKAIIFDLLQVCRASLVRNATGAYEIVQDIPQTVVYTFDERAGDLIDVDEYQSADRPLDYALSYRPRDNEFQYTVKRTAGGFIGNQELQTSVVRDHEAADRLNDYLAKRVKYSATAKATVYVDQLQLGQLLAITSDKCWNGVKQFKVNAITRRAGVNEVDLLEYNSAVYTYTPQTFPADATTGYSPDYSGTPPLAPTSLTVVSQGVALNQDGVAQSYMKVRATPPSVNWKTIFFQATNTATNEIYQGVGTDNAGLYEITLAGLRPNAAHTVVAWAVNAFGVKGIVSGSVGFTSQAWTSAPATPTGLAVTQGTGKLLRLKWNTVAGTNIKGYDIYKKIGAGAFALIETVTGTGYTDNAVNYGTSYSYKIQSEDRAGNNSADSATVALTPAVNVDTADVVNSAITTGLINANAVTSKSYVTSFSAETALTATYAELPSNIVKTVTGGLVIIDWSVLFTLAVNNGSAGVIDFRLKRNGTQILELSAILGLDESASGSANENIATVFNGDYTDAPGTGSPNYTIEAKLRATVSNGMAATYIINSMNVTELKK